MFLKTFHPEPEQAMLEEDLWWLDYWHFGAKWMYTARELSRYNIKRISIVSRIKELEPDYIPPSKGREL